MSFKCLGHLKISGEPFPDITWYYFNPGCCGHTPFSHLHKSCQAINQLRATVCSASIKQFIKQLRKSSHAPETTALIYAHYTFLARHLVLLSRSHNPTESYQGRRKLFNFTTTVLSGWEGVQWPDSSRWIAGSGWAVTERTRNTFICSFSIA